MKKRVQAVVDAGGGYFRRDFWGSLPRVLFIFAVCFSFFAVCFWFFAVCFSFFAVCFSNFTLVLLLFPACVLVFSLAWISVYFSSSSGRHGGWFWSKMMKFQQKPTFLEQNERNYVEIPAASGVFKNDETTHFLTEQTFFIIRVDFYSKKNGNRPTRPHFDRPYRPESLGACQDGGFPGLRPLVVSF